MIWADKTLKAKRPDTQAVLRAAAFPKDFDAYMANMGWMSEHYVRLRRLMGDARARGASEQALDRLAPNLDRDRTLPGPWTPTTVADASSCQTGRAALREKGGKYR